MRLTITCSFLTYIAQVFPPLLFFLSFVLFGTSKNGGGVQVLNISGSNVAISTVGAPFSKPACFSRTDIVPVDRFTVCVLPIRLWVKGCVVLAGMRLKAAKCTVEQPNVRAVCSDTSGRVVECKDRGVDAKEAPAISSLSIHYLSPCTLPWKL